MFLGSTSFGKGTLTEWEGSVLVDVNLPLPKGKARYNGPCTELLLLSKHCTLNEVDSIEL